MLTSENTQIFYLFDLQSILFLWSYTLDMRAFINLFIAFGGPNGYTSVCLFWWNCARCVFGCVATTRNNIEHETRSTRPKRWRISFAHVVMLAMVWMRLEGDSVPLGTSWLMIKEATALGHTTVGLDVEYEAFTALRVESLVAATANEVSLAFLQRWREWETLGVAWTFSVLWLRINTIHNIGVITLSGTWIELHVSGALECLPSCTEAHVISAEMICFFFLVGFVIELRLFFVNGSKADWNLLGTATLLLDKGNGFTIEPAQITIGHIGGHADTALHTEMGTGTAHVWLGKTVVTLNVSTAWCHIRHTENSESRAKWLTTRQSDARASSSSNWRKSSTTYYDEIHANYCARRCRCRQLAYLLAVHREVHHHLHHQQLGGNLAIRPFLEKEPRMRYKAPERYLEFFAINTSHFTKISLLIYYFTKKDESALHKGHAEAPLATNKSLVK